jgi:hypothetical protein
MIMKIKFWLVGISLSILFAFFGFNMGSYLISIITGSSDIFNIIGGLLGVIFGISLGFGMAADIR